MSRLSGLHSLRGSGSSAPQVWGGETPSFASAAEQAAVHQVIFDRFEEIAALLDAGTCGLAFEYDENGDPVASDWAMGFLDGMTLRPDAWQPLLASPDHAPLMDPLFVLALMPDELPPHLQVDPANEGELLLAAANALPDTIVLIAAFWRDRQDSPPA